VRGTILAKNVGTARFLTTVPVVAVSRATESATAPVPDLAVPVADVPSMLALIPQPDVTVAYYALAVPPPAAPPAAAPSSGFIGGALRKTKDSIVRTGAITGATIADAFKGVFGAFKKVNPF
jgi:hypothetical protein